LLFNVLVKSTVWFGLIVTVFFAVLHGLPEWAPQLASLGHNRVGPIEPLLWFGLPMAVWGALCGGLLPQNSLGHRSRVLALAAGAWVGPTLFTQGNALGIAAGTLGVAALLSSSSAARAASMAVVVVVLGLHGWLPQPDGGLGRVGAWSAADSPRSMAQWHLAPKGTERRQHGSTPNGTFVAWESTDSTTDTVLAVDGLASQTQGLPAKTEELLGHLAALFSAETGPAVLLNDSAGNVLRGMAAHPERTTHIAASTPATYQSIASRNPVRQRLWLQPNHLLHRAHPGRLLNSSAASAVIIEVSRAPWADSSNSAMGPHHIERVKSRLAPNGLYALGLHLRWWPDGGPAGLARELTNRFNHVQLWVPPEGVDGVIFLASDEDFDIERMRKRFSGAFIALESLGFF
jgi:hypothetical protein